MGTESETGLRIDDFLGINALVSSEDLQDQYVLKTQNLWERRLGELEPIGGQVAIAPNAGSYGSYANHAFAHESTKMFCNKPTSVIGSVGAEANVTMSFVTTASGKWGSSVSSIHANCFIGCTGIRLIAVGNGLHAQLNSTLVASLPVSGDTKTLRVVVAGALTNTAIENILVYADYNFSSHATGQRYSTVMIGSFRPTAGAYDFHYGPIHFDLAALPANLTYAPGAPSYSLSTQAGGSLDAGTYYVAVLTQELQFDNATETNNLSIWKAYSYSRIEVPGGLSAPKKTIRVTLPAGLGGISTMVAVGKHPLSLTVHGLIKSQQGAPEITHDITSLPLHGICANPVRTSATDNNYFFRVPDVVTQNSAYTYLLNSSMRSWPINFPPGSQRNLNTTASARTETYTMFQDDGFQSVWDSVNGSSDGVEVVFMCHRIEGLNSILPTKQNSQTNLCMFDGNACITAIPQFGVTATPAIPQLKYLTFYNGRLAGSDGKLVYFSKILDAFDWTVPGSPGVLQYVQVALSGEEISGIGVYTNVSGTAGPIGQLLVVRPSASYVVSDFPVYTSGSNNNVSMVQLSGRVGGFHKTIVNTDVGTIMTGPQGVFLIRDDGEPQPIGDHILPYLVPDTTTSVDPTYWHAVYHDQQYKLVYNPAGTIAPNRELWLDIRKMKALKGQPIWNGPHVGRTIYSSATMPVVGSNLKPDRFGCNANVSVSVSGSFFTLDKLDVNSNLGSNRTFIFESKDFKKDEPNSNKIYTRTLWFLRLDQDTTFTEEMVALSVEGEETESQSWALTKLPTHTGGSFTTFLAARQKLYQIFPVLRLRGEAVRKRLTYTGSNYFGISGVTIYSRTEGRRVD